MARTKNPITYQKISKIIKRHYRSHLSLKERKEMDITSGSPGRRQHKQPFYIVFKKFPNIKIHLWINKGSNTISFAARVPDASKNTRYGKDTKVIMEEEITSLDRLFTLLSKRGIKEIIAKAI